jgi:glucose-1-phosphate cytidylyltransferase
MKTFILCGGYGTRLDSLGRIIAKPMAHVGKEPILMHIIKNFCIQGFNDFVLCTGHKYLSINNFFLKNKKKNIKILYKSKKNIKFEYSNKEIFFKCNIVFTGKNNGTGGRIKIAYNKLRLNEDIIMTYGDGLSNVNINKLLKFHKHNKSLVTLTAVRPKIRYGFIKIKNKKINYFDNSNQKNSNVYINGGFFIIAKSIIKSIKDKNTYWENEPLEKLIKKKRLFAYKHKGYWQSLDTLKDLNDLNNQIKNNNILWKFNEK